MIALTLFRPWLTILALPTLHIILISQLIVFILIMILSCAAMSAISEPGSGKGLLYLRR
jgi:hypothetical protein